MKARRKLQNRSHGYRHVVHSSGRRGFLTALLHVPMVDVEARRREAEAMAKSGSASVIELALILVKQRAANARKTARRLARTSQAKASPRLCSAMRCLYRKACNHAGFAGVLS